MDGEIPHSPTEYLFFRNRNPVLRDTASCSFFNSVQCFWWWHLKAIVLTTVIWVFVMHLELLFFRCPQVVFMLWYCQCLSPHCFMCVCSLCAVLSWSIFNSMLRVHQSVTALKHWWLKWITDQRAAVQYFGGPQNTTATTVIGQSWQSVRWRTLLFISMVQSQIHFQYFC